MVNNQSSTNPAVAIIHVPTNHPQRYPKPQYSNFSIFRMLPMRIITESNSNNPPKEEGMLGIVGMM